MSKDDTKRIQKYQVTVRPFGQSNGNSPGSSRRPGADSPQIRGRRHRDIGAGSNSNASNEEWVPPPLVSSDGKFRLNAREWYALTIYITLNIAAASFAGLPGLILMNVGFWVGAIDIGWVDDLFDPPRKDIIGRDPEDEGTTPDPLPDNAPPLPVG